MDLKALFHLFALQVSIDPCEANMVGLHHTQLGERLAAAEAIVKLPGELVGAYAELLKPWEAVKQMGPRAG